MRRARSGCSSSPWPAAAESHASTRHYQRVPLHVYRPIYLDERRPDMAFLFVQQFGDGLVQGDRYRIDIDCGPGSATHITTQAATNVFGARDNFATQLVNLRVGDERCWSTYPTPWSRFAARGCSSGWAGGRSGEPAVILGEILLPGRVAHGEAHAYDLSIRRGAQGPQAGTGTQLFADVLRLGALAGASPRSIGLLDGHEVLSTLWVLTRQMPARELVASLREALIDEPGGARRRQRASEWLRRRGEAARVQLEVRKGGDADGLDATRLAVIDARARPAETARSERSERSAGSRGPLPRVRLAGRGSHPCSRLRATAIPARR